MKPLVLGECAGGLFEHAGHVGGPELPMALGDLVIADLQIGIGQTAALAVHGIDDSASRHRSAFDPAGGGYARLFPQYPERPISSDVVGTVPVAFGLLGDG